MGNMSYCRFRNTLADLSDCWTAIRHGEAENDQLSTEEKDAKARLVKLCKKIVDEIGEEA